jgi:hypothetical protein
MKITSYNLTSTAGIASAISVKIVKSLLGTDNTDKSLK